MIKETTQEILHNLYRIYSPKIGDAPEYVFGDSIVVNFSIGINVEDGDIAEARKFADGLRKQISSDEASITQSSSRVIIKPKL